MYTDEVRVRLAPRCSNSQSQASYPNKPRGSLNRLTPVTLHRVFFFLGGMSANLFFIFNDEGIICRRKRSCILMSTNRGKGSVGEGETGKKTKTTLDTGGKSVSEKSRTTRTPASTPLRNHPVSTQNTLFV